MTIIYIFTCIYIYMCVSIDITISISPIDFELSGQKHQNQITFSPKKQDFPEGCFFNREWPPMLINREWPTPSSIAKHFFGLWVLINPGCLLYDMNLTLCRMPIFRHLHIDSCIWMYLRSSVSYSMSCDHHDAKKMEGLSRHNFKPCEPVFGRKWFVGYVWICFDSLLGPWSKDSKVSVSTVPRKGFTVSHTSSRIPPTIPNVYWLIYMVGKPNS